MLLHSGRPTSMDIENVGVKRKVSPDKSHNGYTTCFVLIVQLTFRGATHRRVQYLLREQMRRPASAARLHSGAYVEYLSFHARFILLLVVYIVGEARCADITLSSKARLRRSKSFFSQIQCLQ